MKCICGYEHISNNWELSERLKDDSDFENGEKQFKESDMVFDFFIGEANYQWDGKETKMIYACPECGTLKIDI